MFIGGQDEVAWAAAERAISVRGHEDTPQLREDVSKFLEPRRELHG